MNKRARNRLIIVTAIILVAAAAVLLWSGALTTAAYSSSVAKAASDASQVGTRVRVTGTVVPGSWDKTTNPMRFAIREEGTSSGPQLNVIYSGAAPSTFGNNTVAIVTGTLEKGALLKADDMITRCPSKYQSKSAAPMALDQFLKATATLTGKTVGVLGFVKAGSLQDSGSPRFVLVGVNGTQELPVAYVGKLPAGVADKTPLIVTGMLATDGTFTATAVAVSK